MRKKHGRLRLAVKRTPLTQLVGEPPDEVVFRILHDPNSTCFRVVQNPENHRSESGGGELSSPSDPVSVGARLVG